MWHSVQVLQSVSGRSYICPVGVTTEKGEIGEAEAIADLRRQGHGIAIPLGHSHAFDLVLIRRDTGELERVQVS